MKTRFLLYFVVGLLMTLLSCRKSDDSSITLYTKSDLSSTVTKEIDAAIQRSLSVTNAPGVIVGIWIDGKGSYVTSAGVANLSTNEPMDKKMHFRIGSVTKTFTGLCVLTLADEGLINLDSAISKYLPELNVPRGSEITVRMLGNMTSGLVSYTEDSLYWTLPFDPYRYWTPDSLLYFSFRNPLMFDPGTQFHYSNTNTVVLGLLIEKITGKSIPEAFRERIFNKEKLENTVWPEGLFIPVPYPHGYTRQTPDHSMEDATYWNTSWGYTAGQLISNLEDLKTHIQTVSAGTLLSENMREQQRHWIITGQGNYGFGIGDVNGWLGHTGEIPGYNTAMYRQEQDNVTVVISVNSDIPGSDGKNPATVFWKAIAKIVTPEHIP